MPQQVTIETFAAELSDLAPPVREKAVEIANELLRQNEALAPRRAVERAIPLAEQWYLDQAG